MERFCYGRWIGGMHKKVHQYKYKIFGEIFYTMNDLSNHGEKIYECEVEINISSIYDNRFMERQIIVSKYEIGEANKQFEVKGIDKGMKVYANWRIYTNLNLIYRCNDCG